MADTKPLKHFNDIVADIERMPMEWKKHNGGMVIGWLKTDVPEELIHAARCLPVGIYGGKTGFDRVDAHLQSWACSLMRSNLAMALNGKLNFLDGLIIPHTCDTTRTISGIWNHVCPLPYMENFFMPRQVDRPSARAYMLGELKRLKDSIEKFTGCVITNQSLLKSIALYNKNRRLLRHLFTLHEENPGLIGSRDLYTVVKSSMVTPKEIHNQWLEQLLDNLATESREQTKKNESKVRVVISGPVWEPPEIMDIIDQQGTVVGDDLLTGYRYFADDVAEEGNPIEALAERQLRRIPFAGYDSVHNPRRNFLVDLAKRKQAQGVIFLHLKFCEPENYDYHDNKAALERAGFPCMRIETEVGGSSLGQVRTRIEAFMEMVGGDA